MQAASIKNDDRTAQWVLGLGAGLLALALGYLSSLDPQWLRLEFDLTRTANWVVFLAAVAVALSILRWPEFGLLGLIAIVFTNASEAGVRFHHLPSILQLLIPLLVIALIGRRMTSGRQRWVWDSTALWILLYGTLILVSSLWAREPQLADEHFWEYLRSFALFLLVTHVMISKMTLRRAAWVLVLAGAFLGTLSVYQVLTSSYGQEFGGFGRIKLAHVVGSIFQPRIAGPLSDPNFYAQILVMLVPVALYRLWDESSLRFKAVAAYALAVILTALVFTYSRGGALALGILLLLTVFNKKVSPRSLLLGLLFLMPLALLAPKGFEGRLGTLKQLLPGSEETLVHRDSSFQERTLFMKTAGQMFLAHPFLGVGAGNYAERYDEYAETVGAAVSTEEDFSRPKFPHNLYLQIAAETGVAGLVLFGIIAALCLFNAGSAIRRFRDAGDFDSASIITSLALGLVGYLVTGLFLHGDYMRCFWLLVAMIVAAKQMAYTR